jgi:hypothetical protein
LMKPLRFTIDTHLLTFSCTPVLSVAG